MSVFVSGGGRRYHAARDCRALESAQLLNDWDCGEYCRHQHPNVHAVGEMPLAEAALMWEPCRVCKPGLPLADDFGHKPIVSFTDGRGLGRVCARCKGQTTTGTWGARWPCATARVLGITDEEAIRG